MDLSFMLFCTVFDRKMNLGEVSFKLKGTLKFDTMTCGCRRYSLEFSGGNAP